MGSRCDVAHYGDQCPLETVPGAIVGAAREPTDRGRRQVAVNGRRALEMPPVLTVTFPVMPWNPESTAAVPVSLSSQTSRRLRRVPPPNSPPQTCTGPEIVPVPVVVPPPAPASLR